MLNCIEDWRLSVLIDVVWVTSCLVQNFHSACVTFSCGVEERSLSITINMVCGTSVFKEKVYQLISAISANVEEASLFQVVLEFGIAANLIEKEFSHFYSVFFVRENARDEEQILIVRLFIYQVSYIFRVLHTNPWQLCQKPFN